MLTGIAASPPRRKRQLAAVSALSLPIVLGLMAWGAVSASGQDAVYAARISSTDTSVWDPPFYWIAAGGTAYGLSTGKSQPTYPVGTPLRAGSYFHNTSTMTVGEGYGLVHTQGWCPNNIYEVDVTMPPGTLSTDVIMSVSSTNCDIGGVFGATAAGGWTNTTAFQAAYCGNQWARVCYLTNRPGVTKPHVEFKYVSGTSLRNYADCVRFHSTVVGLCEPCYIYGVLPVIKGIGLAGGRVTISGSSGPGCLGDVFVLLWSTNLAAPMNSWTPIQTSEDHVGAFGFSVDPGTAQSAFFRVQAQ